MTRFNWQNPYPTPRLPVFARNGTIVPLAAANGMGLHYFPKLGAEFFFLEEDLGERAVGFRIEDEDLEDLRTVRDAVDYVVAKLGAASDG